MSNLITTVLLDLDDTILSDHDATQAALMGTVMHANTVAEVDPHDLIQAVLMYSQREWQEGPFPEWLHAIGTSEVEGLRARFEGEDEHWQVMREWGPQFRLESWTKALRSLGVEDHDLAESLDLMFEKERADTNPWCPGAEEALQWLNDRFTLGMVTNGIPDVQRTKIEATGLTEVFDSIVISGEISVGKPNPAIYRLALEQLKATPEQTIMVGDNYRRDVVGAQALGIRGVWISMGRDLPPGEEPWLTVESMADLPQALEPHIPPVTL